MKLRHRPLFVLSLAFISSAVSQAAFAQPAGPRTDTQRDHAEAAKEDKKTDTKRTDAKPDAKKKAPTSTDKEKGSSAGVPKDKDTAATDKGATERSDTDKSDTTKVLGKELKNEDDDLDMKVGQAETTSATPPRRDVIESRAEERREGEGRRWSVAPLLGYGTNDFNVGLGARAGYTFDTPVYVGGTFMYHFGAETAVVSPLGVTRSETSFYYPGVEVGYDIGIGPVLVRPYGGAALLFGRTAVSTAGVSASETQSALMLYPGVSAHYMFPNSPIFVGGDMRVLLPLEDQDASLSLLGTAGLSL